MCGGGFNPDATGKSPAHLLAELLNRYAYNTGFDNKNVERMIAKDWDKLSKLAHAVHDEKAAEKERLDEAIKTVNRLSVDGLRNVLNGGAASDVIAAVKLFAAEMLKR